MSSSHRMRRVTAPPVESLNARRRALEAQGRSIINLGQAVPDFVPPPEAVAALAGALETPDLHRYTGDPGLPALRAALASWRGVDDPDEIIVTAGANHAFLLAGMALLDPGDAVVLPSPAFLNHRMTLDALGARVVDLPGAPGRGLDLDALEQAVRASGARMVVLCNPSNPTGEVLSADALARAAGLCRATGAWLVVDEVYADLTHAGGFPFAHRLPGAGPCTVSLWSFSKSFGMTGWRLGALRAPPAIYDALIKAQDLSIICAPRPAQALALACLERCADFPQQQVPRFVARQRAVVAALASCEGAEVWPGGAAFFTWFRPWPGGDAPAMCLELLEEAGLALIPGSAFGDAWGEWLRLSYGVVGGAELDEALARLTAWLSAGPRC